MQATYSIMLSITALEAHRWDVKQNPIISNCGCVPTADIVYRELVENLAFPSILLGLCTEKNFFHESFE